MANTYIQRTPSSNGNQKTWTWSGWIKVDGLADGTYQYLLNCYYNNQYRYSYFVYRNGKIEVYGGDYQTSNSQLSFDLTTTRQLRDPNGWYHIVVALDTTQSTASDRLKIYINGTQETSFTAYDGSGSGTYPEQDDISFMNVTTTANKIGQLFNGSMSHVHFCDGYSYAPTEFGSTDSVTGEWKINTSPNVSYGTNGYFILKDGNTITDQSSNSNDFTLSGGTLTKTEDCPSNVFATFNPISGANTMAVNTTFSNGNTSVVNSGSVYNPYGTTIGVNKGKWYAEFKTNVAPGDGMIGVFAKYGASGNYLGSQTHQYTWYNASGGKFASNSSNLATSVGTYTTNDIIGIALDCDNNKLYYHKNGTYMTYGGGTMNPTSGTYGISITDPDDTDLGFYFMSAMDWGGSTRGNWSANFGNGYFGTTAVSSAGTNASGNGIFEYDVPTGFTALSTKGLNL